MQSTKLSDKWQLRVWICPGARGVALSALTPYCPATDFFLHPTSIRKALLNERQTRCLPHMLHIHTESNMETPDRLTSVEWAVRADTTSEGEPQ